MAEEPSFYTTIPLSTSPQPPQNRPSSTAEMRRLLTSCAELLSQSNFLAAHNMVTYLSSTSSPYGDSTERLVHQFAKALAIRLQRAASTIRTAPYSSHHFVPPSVSVSGSSSSGRGFALLGGEEEQGALLNHQLQSSYIFLNQVTPFIRFSHLTANQAILDAIEGEQSVHILDFDTIMQGVQWPPLMQAIAGRPNRPNMIRITGTGYNLETLLRTGQRLENFAESIGLRFKFTPLVLHDSSSVALQLSSSLHFLHDETLVVNCVLYVHRLLNRNQDEVGLFLRTIKAMKPRVVTLAEREANLNNPLFLNRFSEALDHYMALFDSMEATLPPHNTERLSVEQVWLGREIMDVVSAEGEERRERYERFYSWKEKMRRSGFTNAPLSPFAISQAKLLLRLHYPSEGYQLHILPDSMFLGWQNHALFSISSWH